MRINHTIGPRYLHGLQGRVMAVEDERAIVCLHRPVARNGFPYTIGLDLDQLAPITRERHSRGSREAPALG